MPSCPSNLGSSCSSGAAVDLPLSSSLVLGSQYLVLLGSKQSACFCLSEVAKELCLPTQTVQCILRCDSRRHFSLFWAVCGTQWVLAVQTKQALAAHSSLFGVDSSCAAHQSKLSNKVVFERGWKPVCACQPPSSWQETWATPQTKWDGFTIYFLLLCLWKGTWLFCYPSAASHSRGKGWHQCPGGIVWGTAKTFVCLCSHVAPHRQPSCSKLKPDKQALS